MGISIRAYARHRGVSDAAVRKAIAAGRITPEADGTIDSDRADAEWARNTEAPRHGTRSRPVRVAVPQEGGHAPDGAASAPTGGTSLLQARTVNEVVKAQTNKVRLARLKGELVDRSQAIAHVLKLARRARLLELRACPPSAAGFADLCITRVTCHLNMVSNPNNSILSPQINHVVYDP